MKRVEELEMELAALEASIGQGAGCHSQKELADRLGLIAPSLMAGIAGGLEASGQQHPPAGPQPQERGGT